MQKAKASISHPIAGATVFLLIAVFAIMSMFTVILSVNAYSHIQADITSTSDVRLLTGYLTAKLRSGDSTGCISTFETNNGTAIQVLSDGLLSVIYVHDGMLCESIMEVGDEFDPETGIAITDALSMNVRLDDHYMVIDITDISGAVHTVRYYMHSQEVAP